MSDTVQNEPAEKPADRGPRSAEGQLEASSTLGTIGLVVGVLGATAIVFGIVIYAINPAAAVITVVNLIFAGAALVFYGLTNWSSIRRIASGRSTPLVFLEGVLVGGVVLAAVAANYFAAKSKSEWDLTRDQLYTLQEQSVKVAKDLDKDVKIIGFLKPQDSARNALSDLVELYQKHTDRITLEMVNADAVPPAVAKQYKLSPTSPKIVITAGEGRQTKIRQASEQDLTNALVKVAEKPPRKVYFLTGHGEPSLEDAQGDTAYQRASQALADEGFEIAMLSLLEKENIPKDASLLILAGAQKGLFPNETDAINAYLKLGGRVALLLDPGLEHGLDRVLRTYGIDVGDNLVVDANPASRALGLGPDAPVVTEFEQHPITTPLKGSAVLFWWVRSVTPAIGSGNVIVTTLIQTPATSWGETKYKSGGDVAKDEEDLPGPVPVAVAATKSTASVPQKISEETRLVVIGDSSFASNRFIGMSGNGDLLLNVARWLAGEEEKIAIRPKKRGATRIPLTEQQLLAIYFFSTNLLPLLIVGFGFSVWAVRRRM
jgi:ABC-type uncharacterized transport system involved in gliding motility auxiliary subunit